MPVSPLTISGRVGSGRDEGRTIDVEEEELEPKSVVVDDPIVGESFTTLDKNGPGAIEAKPISSPRELTPLQRAKHWCTHLPYDPACDICTATKRPNVSHSKSHEDDRKIPLLVGDYAYLEDSQDSENITLLVMKLYPFRMRFACAVPYKGPEPLVTARIAKWITNSGLTHFPYRSDKEPAMIAMLQQACALAGRKGVHIKSDEDEETKDGVELARVAVPEHSHPGESQSNGLAEKAVRKVTDHIRTMKLALETRPNARLPNDHPVMSWLIEHAAYLLNRFQLSTDGRTAYGRLHGKEASERICDFAECVLWYVPKKHRAKLGARLRYGVFLGRSIGSDQNFIGLAVGLIVTARATLRIVPTLR